MVARVLALLPWLFGAALLGAAVLWVDGRAARASSKGGLGSALQRLGATDAPGRPVILAVDDRRGTLAAALAEDDPRLTDLVPRFQWVVGLEAARARGIVTAPHVVLLAGDEAVDAAEPVGTARLGASALVHALGRFLEGSAAPGSDPVARLERLEAAGAFGEAARLLAEGVAAERSTIGPLHRARDYRAFLAEGLEGDPVESLERYLGSEANARVLHSGWSLVGTLLEDRLAGPTTDAARREAWRRDLWQAAREAYQHAEESDLVPMMELLLARFSSAPESLDSLDRYFAKRLVTKLEPLAPDSPWLERARAAIAPR